MQMAFYFDQSRCVGCYACSVACKDWNDIKAETVHLRRVTSREWGTYPEVRVAYLSLSCNHCESPACVKVCPAGAITKRKEDGVVVVNRARCLGNNVCEVLCKKACPYHIPQFGDEENARMQMCTLCLERLAEHKKPVCVEACPMRALEVGPLDELKSKYGEPQETEGFSYSKITKPSLIIKPRYHLT